MSPDSQTLDSPTAYQLKIILADSEPEIWRRVLVPFEMTLAQLHEVIQLAMGWENLHDYRFQLGLATEKIDCAPQQNLADVLAPDAQQSLYYNYDAVSGWLHRIEVEALEVGILGKGDPAVDPVRSLSLPTCTGGEMACPPEGTGGVWGYDDFLDRLEDANDPDYLTLIDKYGAFDPDAFDVEAAANRLKASTLTITAAFPSS